ncbi:MAG: 50S ribosomal protein L11 methyltransferase [Cyanobacteria bacterium J06641_5]
MANSWWEIRVLCNPVLEETIFWRLETFGCQGTATSRQENGLEIAAYLPQIKFRFLDLSAMALLLRQDALALELPPPRVAWDIIEDEDWASSWKEHWEPQEIGDIFLVYPAWLTPPTDSDRHIIRLDPGAAFGTGIHPTTQLCLEAMEMRLAKAPETQPVIADIGCGSGILSAAALLMGASKVYAADTDSLAVNTARANGLLNGMDAQRLIVELGSIERLGLAIERPVDGILCNILAETIVKLIPQMTTIAAPNCWGVLSGILLDQANSVREALYEHGWSVGALWRRENWCCINIRRVVEDDY